MSMIESLAMFWYNFYLYLSIDQYYCNGLTNLYERLYDDGVNLKNQTQNLWSDHGVCNSGPYILNTGLRPYTIKKLSFSANQTQGAAVKIEVKTKSSDEWMTFPSNNQVIYLLVCLNWFCWQQYTIVIYLIYIESLLQ